jgi:hypothetical protein
MAEFKMINLGVYYEHLKETIEQLEADKKKKTDPYEQWNLAEQKKIVQKLLVDYQRLIVNQDIK